MIKMKIIMLMIMMQLKSGQMNQFFFIKREGKVLKTVTADKKLRRNISTAVGGKAITESDTFAKVQEFKEGSNKKPEKGKTKAQKAKSTQKTNEKERKQGKQNESRCSLRVNKQDHRKYMYQQLKLKMKNLHLMTLLRTMSHVVSVE